MRVCSEWFGDQLCRKSKETAVFVEDAKAVYVMDAQTDVRIVKVHSSWLYLRRVRKF